MIKVFCRTNLDDVMRHEIFPTELPAVPRVGDKIQSAQKWGQAKTQIELKVIDVTWKRKQEYSRAIQENCDVWYAEIELGMTRIHSCISDFQNWYDYVRGKIAAETYSRRASEIRKLNRKVDNII